MKTIVKELARRLVKLKNGYVSVNAGKRLSHFWNLWYHGYLDLKEQHKVGECVLAKNQNIKRQLWRTGLMDGLVKGKAGAVRGEKHV